MPYQKPVKYTDAQLLSAKIADLQADIDFAEKQAVNGPFYPEKGITKESLSNYANECRKELEGLKSCHVGK